MRILKPTIMLLVAGLLCCPVVNSATSKGFGEIEYKGLRGPSKDEEREALKVAKINSLKNHAANFSKSRYSIFSKVEDRLVSSIDEIVLNFTVLEEEKDKTSKRFRVFIEATLNDNLIERILDEAGVSQPEGASEPSFLAGVVIAREVSSIKQYDDKRQSVRQVNAELNESQNISADGANVNEKADSTVVETTGGSVEIKADVLNYRVFAAGGVDVAIGNVLSEFNYQYVPAGDAGVDINQFIADFSSGDDVQPRTRIAAGKLLKELGIPFLSIYTMTVSPAKEDPNTLQPRVDVMVDAQVYDLTKPFPVRIAAVAAKPFAGLGVDNQVAQANALNKAGAETAQLLVEILRSKGIR